jgi:hypothetical protein
MTAGQAIALEVVADGTAALYQWEQSARATATAIQSLIGISKRFVAQNSAT